MDVKAVIKDIISYMPDGIRPALRDVLTARVDSVQEITLRLSLPLCIYCTGKRYYLTSSGVSEKHDDSGVICTSPEDIHSVFMRLCDYSVYSKQEQINSGYLTASHGVRVGICGTGVIKDGRIENIRNITTLSFRVPREVRDCSERMLSLMEPLRGMLICSPPSGGKTTMLRDMARRLSYIYRVTVIDERGELSASGQGRTGFELGFSDIYINVPKGEAVVNSVRSLSPDIIICDEIGDRRDADSVSYALRCGAAFIASVHASSLDDLRARAVTRELLDSGAFGYIVMLGDRTSPGTVKHIYEWNSAHA